MEIVTLGIDLAKNIFALHGVDATGKVVLQRPAVKRGKLLELTAGLPPCLIGMEACSGAHHWAREMARQGHEVRLIAPKFVAPYRMSGKRGKNDAADAQAICEAVARPAMRFVPIKSVEQQSELFLHRARQGYVEQRTGLINRVRGLLSELGIVLPQKADIHAERTEIYGALARRWLRDINQVLVVVDWSDLTDDQRWHLLRASVAVEGRSVTLYEEVHPRHRLASRWVHQRFLAKLARLLPAGCTPLIMTDAGFRSPWFEALSRRHWPWVGRVRNRDLVSIDGCAWRKAKDLYAVATDQPREFVDVLHVRKHPVRRRFVLVKESAKGRIHRTRLGQRCRSKRSLQSAQREREPWLLACAPELDHLSPSAIVALYAQRMRIEESFRDTKSERKGMGLSETRSRSAQRLELLLMIGHLAAWLLRLIGEGAQQCQMALRFQSTGRTDRKEISVMSLPSRVVQEPLQWLTPTRLHLALDRLRLQVREACHVA